MRSEGVPDPKEKAVHEQLVEVVIETTLNAKYVFPDMAKDVCVRLVQALTDGMQPGQITLVNASSACLVLPSRIVQVLRVYGKIEGAPMLVAAWVRVASRD